MLTCMSSIFVILAIVVAFSTGMFFPPRHILPIVLLFCCVIEMSASVVVYKLLQWYDNPLESGLQQPMTDFNDNSAEIPLLNDLNGQMSSDEEMVNLATSPPPCSEIHAQTSVINDSMLSDSNEEQSCSDQPTFL